MVLIAAAVESFQPIDLTSQSAQSLRILHVDPEVASDIDRIHEVARGDDNSSQDDSPLARQVHRDGTEIAKTDKLNLLLSKDIANIWVAQSPQFGFAFD